MSKVIKNFLSFYHTSSSGSRKNLKKNQLLDNAADLERDTNVEKLFNVNTEMVKKVKSNEIKEMDTFYR